jgi:DNA polymerase sigma
MFGTSPYRSGQGFAPPGQKRNTPSLPPPIRLDLADLDGQLLQLAERLAPSAEQRQRQQQAWGSVQGLLQALWPDAGVHLFGSAANELDVGGSNDLDVCLEVEGVEETKEARGGCLTFCNLFACLGPGAEHLLDLGVWRVVEVRQRLWLL